MIIASIPSSSNDDDDGAWEAFTCPVIAAF
jgi:hypothetical protein